mmetsp:Transcript_14676/g.47633  ORF Transcript_14676/g.47633 Transcript_14676/m.47633 type:complete len:213 (-) Transcript_14676:106-744(-)
MAPWRVCTAYAPWEGWAADAGAPRRLGTRHGQGAGIAVHALERLRYGVRLPAVGLVWQHGQVAVWHLRPPKPHYSAAAGSSAGSPSDAGASAALASSAFFSVLPCTMLMKVSKGLSPASGLSPPKRSLMNWGIITGSLARRDTVGRWTTGGQRSASAEPASMKRAIYRAPAGGVQASAGTRWSEAFAPVLHREPHSQAFACWQHSCGGACVC